MNNEIILYGAGGHCKVVMDILEAQGLQATRLIDDEPSEDTFMGLPVLSGETVFDKAIVTIGNCNIRKEITERIKVNEYLTAIHPSAIICKNVEIGEGSVIVHGAIIQSSASIGKHCIVNTKASVGHDSKIGDYVHVASGSTICGGVSIGERTWIGAGSVVKQGIKIGKNCMIGVGSVVVKDIPDNVVAYGNPCRVVRER